MRDDHGWRWLVHIVYIHLYDGCMGGSKQQSKVYYDLLIRCLVNHCYDKPRYSMVDRQWPSAL